VSLLVLPPELATALPELELSAPTLLYDNLSQSGRAPDVDFSAGDQALFVQFSSGSTQEPRGCVLTEDAIVHQLHALEQAIDFDRDRDRMVSWLPLSHDMGMFGALLFGYWSGISLTLGTPQRFLRAPRTWVEDCARHAATTTLGPNFAFDLLSRFGPPRGLSPFPMRKCVVGGEPVQLATLQRLHRVFGDEYFPREAFLPAYGLAESVLAVAMKPVGQPPRALTVDANALWNGTLSETEPNATGSVDVVSNGFPVLGTEIRINGPDRVGEICIRSGSLARGYLNDPRATESVFIDHELHTRDHGFLEDGELFVTGRRDDMFTVAGRNVFARDVEALLTSTQGIRPGCLALVDVRRRHQTSLSLLAELAEDAPRARSVAQTAATIIRKNTGLALDECHFLPAGGIPKTPSGKLQRFRCRQLAMDPPSGSVKILLRSAPVHV
jgi:acyl-CoA synthetase (AMP-forming)/AMP-acid ligase II